jgi:Tol biopolymer transport system component
MTGRGARRWWALAVVASAAVACGTVVPPSSPSPSTSAEPSAATSSGRPTQSASPGSTFFPLTPPDASPLPPATPPGSIPPPLDRSGFVGRIAYSHEGDVWTVRADGSAARQLTTDPEMDFDPSWSPDGERIAFRTHRDGNEEVYVMAADGSGQWNLSDAPGGDYSPAWSPDGTSIAFMSDRGGNANIWLMGPDGTGVRQLTDLPGISEYPTWSPDGRRLAFHCSLGQVLANGTADFEICVVDADGTNLRLLTDAPGESKVPAWSPDGRLISFETNRHGWPTLPELTPEGFDPEAFGDSELYVMDASGENERMILVNPEQDDGFPAWSRDGHLLFSRYGALLVTDATGAEPVEILDAFAGGQFPDWWQPA